MNVIVQSVVSRAVARVRKVGGFVSFGSKMLLGRGWQASVTRVAFCWGVPGSRTHQHMTVGKK